MKNNNKITMEMAQKRADVLFGERYFEIIEWNGSKKTATISYGEYDSVELTINRGEYLYQNKMIESIKKQISEAVQKHLDQQNKNITLVSMDGQWDPALGICQCCGEELRFKQGYKLTSIKNKCYKCKSMDQVSEKAMHAELEILGIKASHREDELHDLLFKLEKDLEKYTLQLRYHELTVQDMLQELEDNEETIELIGIHKYMIQKLNDSYRCYYDVA